MTYVNPLALYLAEYIKREQVVGWIIKDLPEKYTTSPEVCAEWHKQGLDVAPVYIKRDNVENKETQYDRSNT